jgi:hypothetical protein
VTTILLAVLLAMALACLFFQNRSQAQTLLTILRASAEERKDSGTKALQRAEQSSTKAMALSQKTIDSLCRIFEAQMSPAGQATEPPRQGELQLEWESTPHPSEVREAAEAILDNERRSIRILPQMGWSSPEKIEQDLRSQQSESQPDPAPMLVPMDYDPSP